MKRFLTTLALAITVAVATPITPAVKATSKSDLIVDLIGGLYHERRKPYTLIVADWYTIKGGQQIYLSLVSDSMGSKNLKGDYRAWIWSPTGPLYGMCLKYIANYYQNGELQYGESSLDCPTWNKLTGDNGSLISYGFPTYPNSTVNELYISSDDDVEIFVVFVSE